MQTSYDVIVAGGGFAGAVAALAAAREGAKVLLLEKSNCLGGTATVGLVNPFMCYWTHDPVTNEKHYLSRGIFEEIVRDLRAMGPLGMHPTRTFFGEEHLKLLLNRKLLEAGVTLLFHAYLSEAEVADGQVRAVKVVSRGNALTFTASVFIDATGDGNLSVLCGCPFDIGRTQDSLCQPMTLSFRMGGVDTEALPEQVPAMQTLFAEFRKEGKLSIPKPNVHFYYALQPGVIHFNGTRIVKRNPIDPEDVTLAEIEAREQVFELVSFLQQNVPAFRNSFLFSTATEIGIRESRRILGDYLLTQEDLIACTRFEDSIAVCNYDIDIHSPTDDTTSHRYFDKGEYYTIPYRCLTPLKTRNLLVAGRCISATHEAQASLRIMAPCACLGEAAGTAAAMAFSAAGDVRAIDVQALRARLTENGAVV